MLSTEQSTNLVLKTNRQLTKEIASPKKFIPDVISKDFTREQTQLIKSFSAKSNPIDVFNDFDFKDLKKREEIHVRIQSLGSKQENYGPTQQKFLNSSVGGKATDCKIRNPWVQF